MTEGYDKNTEKKVLMWGAIIVSILLICMIGLFVWLLIGLGGLLKAYVVPQAIVLLEQLDKYFEGRELIILMGGAGFIALLDLVRKIKKRR